MDNNYKSEYLYNAIDDVNNTIRFLDSKIGAVFVGISLCLTLLQLSAVPIQNLYNSYSQNIFLQTFLISIFVVYTGCLIFSVGYGFITIKTQRPPKIETDNKDLIELWYISKLQKNKPIQIFEYYKELKTMTKEDCMLSILAELLKLSYIRNNKSQNTSNCILFFIYSLIPMGILFLCIMIHGIF